MCSLTTLWHCLTVLIGKKFLLIPSLKCFYLYSLSLTFLLCAVKSLALPPLWPLHRHQGLMRMLNFLRLLLAHYPACSSTSGYQTCPSAYWFVPCSFVSSADLTRVHSVTSLKSLMKMLSRLQDWPLWYSPHYQPWDREWSINRHPLSTNIQPRLDTSGWSAYQNYNVPTWIQQYRGKCVASSAEVEINDLNYSSINQKLSLWKQSDWSWFSFCKFLLTVPYHLILHVCRSTVHWDSLHEFVWDWSIAVQYLVPWMFFLHFFKVFAIFLILSGTNHDFHNLSKMIIWVEYQATIVFWKQWLKRTGQMASEFGMVTWTTKHMSQHLLSLCIDTIPNVSVFHCSQPAEIDALLSNFLLARMYYLGSIRSYCIYLISIWALWLAFWDINKRKETKDSLSLCFIVII